MMFELVVEKYKQSQREAGIKIGLAKGLEEGQEIGLAKGLEEGQEIGLAKGLEEGQEIGLAKGLEEGQEIGRQESEREVRAWYERQQAALRAGLPFDEPPPGYSPETSANGKDAG